MENLSGRAAIVGVGDTPQGRTPGRSAKSLYIEACLRAMADVGLKREEVDGLLLQPTPTAPDISTTEVAQHLGLPLRFTATLDLAGATSVAMVHHAAMAVVHGFADYVLCAFGDNPVTGMPGAYGAARARRGEAQAYGRFGAPASFALAARRGMFEYGTGPQVWSQIAIAQRRWANLNPRAAMYGRPMTMEDYFNARWVVEPLRLFDCCLVSDIGRAFIVTTAERARSLAKPPVYVLGMGQDHPTRDMLNADYLTGPIGAKGAGARALAMAGLALDDIDACELYDCFTYTVEQTLMGYGFFKKGEAGDWITAERLGPGGSLPVNTSGGLLSEAYSQGFTPLCEAVVQLRGEAGERQLGPVTGTKAPDIILVSGHGGLFQLHSTVILGR